MSLIGLSATIFSVYAISHSAVSEEKSVVEDAYRFSRALGKSNVLLSTFTKSDSADFQRTESEFVRVVESRNPGWSFWGALDSAPAFPPVSDSDPDQFVELGPRLNRRHYCWTDDRQSTLLICLFRWDEIQPRETDDEYGPGESLPLSAALAISRINSSDPSFRSTHSVSSLPDLGSHENVLDLADHQAGSVAELIESHRSFVGQADLDQIDPKDVDVLVSDFFQQRAFRFANRGGDSLEEGVQKFVKVSGADVDSVVAYAGIHSIVIGKRNGVSKQFDQFVLERMSRDSTVLSGVDSSLPPLVVQPLSCPIRMQSVLRRLNGTLLKPLDTGIVLSPDAILDLPADLTDQIESLGNSGNDIRETATRFGEVFNERPELEMVFQMKEPFPATVYYVKEQP